MALEPDAQLVVNREVDVRTLPLSPAEFFLLSRVESLGGETKVSRAITASGQPEAEATKAIERLIDLRALKLVLAPGTKQTARPEAPEARASSSTDMRERARNRRRQLLEAQMRVVRGGSAAPKPEPEPSEAEVDAPAEEASLPTPRQDQQQARPPELRSILDEVEPVAANDPRLEPDAAVDLDRQRRLLALRDRLRHVGHFALLGLDPIDDPKVIRRAYHTVSREFHPDSFYGKNLGSFRGVLDDLFRRARASYEFLLDPQRRRPLVEAYRAQLEAERPKQSREQSGDKAENREGAQKARDAERAKRIRDRALEQRRKQARKHAEQARRERDTGRHGTAATLFRMAYEHDPGNAEYERQWRECLATARRARAELAYDEGDKARKSGRWQDAARHFASAADADPTLRHLAAAASSVAEVDPEQACEFAMAALESLQQSKARGLPLDPQIVVGVHQSCAAAFLAAGQTESALEQAREAHALAPSDQTRTLLNSIKLT